MGLTLQRHFFGASLVRLRDSLGDHYFSTNDGRGFFPLEKNQVSNEEKLVVWLFRVHKGLCYPAYVGITLH